MPKEKIGNIALSHLWIEVTNKCNLHCVHCYAGSGPNVDTSAEIDDATIMTSIEEAAALGCRSIQFIGGEPLLNSAIPEFIKKCKSEGIDKVEIYSNLLSVNPAVWQAIKRHNVQLATSFYSHDPKTFTQITENPTAFLRITKNIQNAIERGIELRVGIVRMDQNRGQMEETAAYLKSLGVVNISFDTARAFGRFKPDTQPIPQMSDLCGACAGGTACIAPNGDVSSCIMSKHWPLGSIKNTSLSDIMWSKHTSKVKQQIGIAVLGLNQEQNGTAAQCLPQTCLPNDQCLPRQCLPLAIEEVSAQCLPQTCLPNDQCLPRQCLPMAVEEEVSSRTNPQ